MKFKIKIEKLVYGGRGLGRFNGRAVFVPHTAPGDIVLVEETSRKNSYSEAEVVEILEESPFRTKPKCPHFGKCGGCDWQHIVYEKQVEFKKAILEENLQKIGKIKKPNISKSVPSNPHWHYRNRAQIKVKNGKVGFYAKQSHQIVEINRCPLLKEDICEIFPRIKRLIKELPPQPLEFHVYSSSKNEVLLKIILPPRFKLFQLSLEKVREVLGINVVGYGIYRQASPFPERIRFFGREFTYENVGKYKFRVSADSFFQVNRFQVENLINAVSKVATEHQYMLAGDLYCGVGTLTIPAGRYVHRAFGIEANFSAVSDALYNKDINGLRNVTFYCRETEEGLQIIKEHNPDILIIDPPRSGLNERIIREISNLSRIRKLVYVSCNPSTLSRDIATFHKYGINMERAKVIDMFPQTYHVETVAYLRKVK